METKRYRWIPAFAGMTIVAFMLSAGCAWGQPHRLPNDLKMANFGLSGQAIESASGFLLGWGTSVPSDGTTGYVNGALYFALTDGATNTALYTNQGDMYGSNFEAVQVKGAENDLVDRWWDSRSQLLLEKKTGWTPRYADTQGWSIPSRYFKDINLFLDNDSEIWFGDPGTAGLVPWASAGWNNTRGALHIDGLGRHVTIEGMPDRYQLRWFAGQDGLVVDTTAVAPAVKDPNFYVTGHLSSADDVTYDTANAGLKMETDGSAGCAVILSPSSSGPWGSIKLNPSKKFEWTARILPWSVTCEIIAGAKLTSSVTNTTDNDQAFFYFKNGEHSNVWRTMVSVGGTDYASNTIIPMSPGTAYDLGIRVGSDRKPTFYINGVEMSAWQPDYALTAGAALMPFIGTYNVTAVTSALTVGSQSMSREF